VLACYCKDFPLKEHDSSPPPKLKYLTLEDAEILEGEMQLEVREMNLCHNFAEIFGGERQWEVPLTEGSSRS